MKISEKRIFKASITERMELLIIHSCFSVYILIMMQTCATNIWGQANDLVLQIIVCIWCYCIVYLRFCFLFLPFTFVTLSNYCCSITNFAAIVTPTKHTQEILGRLWVFYTSVLATRKIPSYCVTLLNVELALLPWEQLTIDLQVAETMVTVSNRLLFFLCFPIYLEDCQKIIFSLFMS